MEKKSYIKKSSISYILQFIDGAKFMASSLSSLVNNLSEGIHRIICKCEHHDKNCETCRQNCNCFLEYINFKDILIGYKYLCCDKNYQHNFDEKLKERFFNTYKFSNNDNNKFILLLQKVVYPYVYMNDWEKFNLTLLPEKEDFYSHLNTEDITEIKNLREYHDLYVTGNTLLLADVF